MNRILKLEMRRAFSSFGFWVALIAGNLFAVLHLVTEIIPIHVEFNNSLGGGDIAPQTVWYAWLGWNIGGTHAYNYIYYTIVPILAVLPYAVSGWEDIKSSYRVQLCTRIERKKYFKAKYFAVFVSGGTVCTIPILFDLLLCYLFLPGFPISASYCIGPSYSDAWAELFYTCPLAYALVFTVILFCFGGVYACMGLAVTELLENRFLIQIFPYIFLLLIGYLMTIVPYDVGIRLIFFFFFFNPRFSGGYTWLHFVLYFVIYFVITLFLWMRGGKKHELYH